MNVSGDFCEECGSREEYLQDLEDALNGLGYEGSVDKALKELGLE
jgi:hypothetical protein